MGKFKGFKELEFEEIRKYTNNFSKENFITKFQFGTVYRGTDGHHKFTVKIWDNDVGDEDVPGDLGAESLLIELCVYRKEGTNVKGHANAVSYCDDENLPRAIVYDLNPLDSLQNLIPRDNFLWADRIKVALGFASCLKSFHAYGCKIRNINAAHIMCDQEYTPTLYDFSLLTGGFWCAGLYGPYIGSYGYTDPYYINTGQCSQYGDVFAYGVVLLGLISKRVINAEMDKESDFVDKWAEIEYEWQRTQGLKRPSLVNKSLMLHSYFSAEDGRKITKLAMQCIKYDIYDCPQMDEVVRTLERLKVVSEHHELKVRFS